ncbi:MAG: sporulation initiation factor Spo0A C-terminal domain-containing protein [Clostridia bacterium]|nr:sporulation initiation factor Spo0A C-terminal domain-containing protein [Clostridia bacterium]
MKSFKIVFCETNGSLLSNAIGFFRDDNEIELIPCQIPKEATESGIESVQALVIDESFPCVREVIYHFREKGAKIVLTGNFALPDDGFIADYPSDFVLYKPYSLLELRARLIKSFVQQSISVRLSSAKNIDERLSNIFIRAGIPPHIKGYAFLREAVKLSIAQPEMINSITKQLYPAIARMHDTSSSKVERAIRHAIEVAWNRGKIENINAIFGIKIYNKGEKPTNGELIALVADKIMIESM